MLYSPTPAVIVTRLYFHMNTDTQAHTYINIEIHIKKIHTCIKFTVDFICRCLLNNYSIKVGNHGLSNVENQHL